MKRKTRSRSAFDQWWDSTERQKAGYRLDETGQYMVAKDAWFAALLVSRAERGRLVEAVEALLDMLREWEVGFEGFAPVEKTRKTLDTLALTRSGKPQPKRTPKGLVMVYLIHFDRPYWHSQHYLGSTDDLPQRLQTHKDGNGARLLAVITQAGIGWIVARTWEGGKDLERRLKRRKNGRKLCPLCTNSSRPKETANAIRPTS